MADNANKISVAVYAPALAEDDPRPVAMVRGLEGALPGLRLGWTLTEKEELLPLPQRDEWILANRLDGGFPFLCNEDDNYPVTVSAWENPKGLCAGGPPHLEVHLSLYLREVVVPQVVDALEAVAEGACAFWGYATPFDAAVEISRQTRDPVWKPGEPPRGLPALRLSEYLRAPEIPHCLGWLNYWSAATAQALGFPDPSRDASLLSWARRTATGGWVVRLTEEPLDLDRAEHLEALKRAYERFPEIGGRTPATVR